MNLLRLIENEDCLSIFVWSRRDPEGFIDAFNSFPRGEKMKYKQAVRSMEQLGQEVFQGYLEEACPDDLWIDQTMDEIGPDNFSYITEVLRGIR
jgi:hypothetical protein